MQPLTKKHLTLLALALADSRGLSPVQLQKVVFRLQSELPIDSVSQRPASRYSFTADNYGMYCPEVQNDAYLLVEQGLADTEPPNSKKFRVISANDHLINRAKKLIAAMPLELFAQAKSIVEWVLEQDFSSLVSAMYDVHPEHAIRTIFRSAPGHVRNGSRASSAVVPVGQLISAGYSVSDRITLQRYLRAHPFLFSILLEGTDYIKSYFPDAAVKLELFRDPESMEDDERLFVNVDTRLGANESIDRLRSLQRNWWFSRMPAARGRLSIDVTSA
ncbi:MAG: hypothetical protein M3014_09840 [Chloroflexota bacterium]|nr:hypothetical protein [Chloroflexota bacterium]